MKSLFAPQSFGLSLALIGASVLPVAAETQPQSWPQWRGPTGNGLVPEGNPPLEWGEDLNVKWKVEIPGRGHATPIIWGNRLFVLTVVSQETTGDPSRTSGEPRLPGESPSVRPGGDQASTQRPQAGGPRRFSRGPGGRGGFGGGGAPTEEHSFKTLCLDRATGRVLWEKESCRVVPHQGIQPSNTYASGSPVTDGERLYVSFGSQGLYCYDLEGNEIWRRDLGKASVTFGEGSSPALAGDVLIVLQDTNDDSFLYGIDKQTGQEVWRTAREEGSGWTTPYVLEQGGRTQVVVNGTTAVRSYDPTTGELLWQCSGLGSNPIPTIVSDADTVYAMSGHRNGAALAIRLGQTGDLSGTDAVRWRVDRGTPYVPSPLLYDGLLFFCQRTSGMLTCIDAATGKAHYEQERVDAIPGIYASPIGVQNRIYWAGQNGVTLVFERAEELNILARNELDDGFDASPAVVGDELFLRGRHYLYCIAED